MRFMNQEILTSKKPAESWDNYFSINNYREKFFRRNSLPDIRRDRPRIFRRINSRFMEYYG